MEVGNLLITFGRLTKFSLEDFQSKFCCAKLRRIVQNCVDLSRTYGSTIARKSNSLVLATLLRNIKYKILTNNKSEILLGRSQHYIFK